MRRDLERLADISEAIAKIEQYSVQGKTAFLEQELIQTWMLYQLQIIGEAARGVSTEMMEQYSGLPLSDAIEYGIFLLISMKVKIFLLLIH